MLILALDTSGSVASCALLRDGELLEQAVQESRMDHSRLLLPLCQELLARHGLKPAQVDAFAAVIGPGSFTGIRIGTAAVKGFAWALDRPCAGVSSLEAMAFDWAGEGTVCCSIKARPGERYFALFRREGTAVTRLTPDAVGTDEQVEAALAQYAPAAHLQDCQRASGAAKAAWAQAQTGHLQNCHEILPAYLRLSQAERMRKERMEA